MEDIEKQKRIGYRESLQYITTSNLQSYHIPQGFLYRRCVFILSTYKKNDCYYRIFYTLLISSLYFEETGGLGQKCSNRKWLRIKRIGGKIVKQEKSSN